MSAKRTPQECIKEAIWRYASSLDSSHSREEQLYKLADAVLEYLDAEGYTLIDADAVWQFHYELQDWLNEDYDAFRLGQFIPYAAWQEVYRRLPPDRSGRRG